MLKKKSNKPGKQKLSRCNVKRKKAKKAEVVDAEDAQRPMCDGLWSQSLQARIGLNVWNVNNGFMKSAVLLLHQSVSPVTYVCH